MDPGTAVRGVARGRACRARGCYLVAALLLLWVPLAAVAKPPPQAQVRHPFLATQPADTPDSALLAVEIPAGSATKYEIGADGLVYVDRFVAMPVAYPANYGSIPRSLAGDGDPLDALVFTRASLHPSTLIRFRPVGVLRMTDGGDRDEKIIGVPVEGVDPTYAGIRDIGDLPQAERERIEAFFRVYKDLPQGRGAVVLDGFGDAAEARALVREALARFADAGR